MLDQTIINNTHLFYINGQALVLNVSNSRVYRLDPPADLILGLAKTHGEEEIDRILIEKGYLHDEVDKAIFELKEIVKLEAKRANEISSPLAEKQEPFRSIYFSFSDQKQNARKPEILRETIEWFIGQGSEEMFLIFDLEGINFTQSDLAEINDFIEKGVHKNGKEITITILFDSMILPRYPISFLDGNNIKPILKMDNFYRVKQSNPAACEDIITRIKDLHLHRRSVASLSSIFDISVCELKSFLDEIRRWGFIAFYSPRVTCPISFLSGSPIQSARNISEEELKQYFDVIQEAVRPYFEFVNKVFISERGDHGFRCRAGIDHIALSSSGQIYPCTNLIGEDAFRIHEYLQLNADQGSVIGWKRSPSLVDSSDCQLCWARNFCGSGCYLNPVQNQGSQSLENMQCRISRCCIESLLAHIYKRGDAHNTYGRLWKKTLRPFFPHLIGTLYSNDELKRGISMRAVGQSMFPTIQDGDYVDIEYVHPEDVCDGDIVIFERDGTTIGHRVLRRMNGVNGNEYFLEKGDSQEQYGLVQAEMVFGRVVTRHLA